MLIKLFIHTSLALCRILHIIDTIYVVCVYFQLIYPGSLIIDSDVLTDMVNAHFNGS